MLTDTRAVVPVEALPCTALIRVWFWKVSSSQTVMPGRQQEGDCTPFFLFIWASTYKNIQVLVYFGQPNVGLIFWEDTAIAEMSLGLVTHRTLPQGFQPSVLFHALSVSVDYLFIFLLIS